MTGWMDGHGPTCVFAFSRARTSADIIMRFQKYLAAASIPLLQTGQKSLWQSGPKLTCTWPYYFYRHHTNVTDLLDRETRIIFIQMG